MFDTDQARDLDQGPLPVIDDADDRDWLTIARLIAARVTEADAS